MRQTKDTRRIFYYTSTAGTEEAFYTNKVPSNDDRPMSIDVMEWEMLVNKIKKYVDELE